MQGLMYLDWLMIAFEMLFKKSARAGQDLG